MIKWIGLVLLSTLLVCVAWADSDIDRLDELKKLKNSNELLIKQYEKIVEDILKNSKAEEIKEGGFIYDPKCGNLGRYKRDDFIEVPSHFLRKKNGYISEGGWGQDDFWVSEKIYKTLPKNVQEKFKKW